MIINTKRRVQFIRSPIHSIKVKKENIKYTPKELLISEKYLKKQVQG